MFIWYFRAWKLLILVSRVSGCCCLSVFDFIGQIIIRTAHQWQIIGACFRLQTDIANLISFVGKILMSAHLTNETSYWLKKLLMHLNWAIYNVSDLNTRLKYRPPCLFFFPTLSQDRARPIPLAQPEACPQRSERPVCARSQALHRPSHTRHSHHAGSGVGCVMYISITGGQSIAQCTSLAVFLAGVAPVRSLTTQKPKCYPGW